MHTHQKKTAANFLTCILIILCGSAFSIPAASAQESPLFTALKNNNLQELKTVLEQKINVNVYDDDSDHVLMVAAMYASADCMDLLIKNGADVNVVNRTGETPLMWCNHDIAKTKLLLQHGANLNAVAKSGNTPLLIACVGYGQYEIIKLLLDNGANPLAKNNKDETALFRIGLFGDTATARLLLNKGADVNARTNLKETILENAISNENKTMAYWLLNNGADPNITDSYDATALFYAVGLNDINLLKAVLEKTTDINCVDTERLTALMWACYDEHENPVIIRALVDRGANLNMQDKKGQTALAWALKKGNTSKAAILRNAGALQ